MSLSTRQIHVHPPKRRARRVAVAAASVVAALVVGSTGATAAGLPLDNDELRPALSGGPLLPPSTFSDGFVPFWTTVQTRRTYSLRLVDRVSEPLRAAATAAAARITYISGVRIDVKAGTTTNTIPDRNAWLGEIVLGVDATSPCTGSWAGCAGPDSVTETPIGIVKVDSGRIWIHPDVLSYTTTEIEHVVAHELGHALGLGHRDGLYAGQVQVMNSGTDPMENAASYAQGGNYQLGDRNGLMFVSPPPSLFELSNVNMTFGLDLSYSYGDPGQTPLKGDWDGDGVDTPGTFDPATATWYLRNSNTSGTADVTFVYGNPGDIPVVGDWNGDGTDTIGVRRGHIWYLRNSNSPGAADIGFGYGDPTDTPVVGDWDGDGTDTIGVHRGHTWYLRNSNTTGGPDIGFAFGNPGDKPVVGDWDGDGTDTIGVRRPTIAILWGTGWYLRNSNTPGAGEITVYYGEDEDTPLPGDWDGDGIDTVGVRR